MSMVGPLGMEHFPERDVHEEYIIGMRVEKHSWLAIMDRGAPSLTELKTIFKRRHER